MQEVYSLLKQVIDKIQNKSNNGFSDLLESIEEIDDKISLLRTKITGNISSPNIDDLVEKGRMKALEDEIRQSYTTVINRDIIKRKKITNDITYEVQRPLSSYDHIKLLREAIAEIKQYDSQPQIVKEAFNFCTAISDKVFLFLERRNQGCFAGYEGYVRDKEPSEVKPMVQNLKIALDEENIITGVYHNKAPYIGPVPDKDASIFEALGFEKNDTVSIFPILLKGTVVAVFVFNRNVWEYAHLLDILLITAELKMELTFAKRKTEPHYPVLDITQYMDSEERLQKRTILKQDRFEKDEPEEVRESIQEGLQEEPEPEEEAEVLHAEEDIEEGAVVPEEEIESGSFAEEEEPEPEAEAEILQAEEDIEEGAVVPEEEIESGSFAEEEEPEPEAEAEILQAEEDVEEEAVVPEEEMESGPFAEEEEPEPEAEAEVLQAEEDIEEEDGVSEEEIESGSFVEEEEELDRETEQIYIDDAAGMMEEDFEESDDIAGEAEEKEDVAEAEAEEEGFIDRSDNKEKRDITDELTIPREDSEFDEEVLEEDNFDYEEEQSSELLEEAESMPDEDIEQEMPEPETGRYAGDRTQQIRDSEFDEDDMGFDENDIEGEIEGELGPIPEEIKEQPVKEEAAAEEEELSEEEQTLFDEARRFARLVVSEIKLYYEEDVKKGRLNKNLYQLLKVHIDRGRALYDGRVSETVKKSRDFYHEALIDILAAGDESNLGM